jgi:hypothetical protein
MQIHELELEVCLIILPVSVYAGRGVPLQLEERQPEKVDIDVVKERGEPFLLPLPCCLSYAFQRL